MDIAVSWHGETYGDEIRLYYGGSNYTHGTPCLYRAERTGRLTKFTGSLGLATWKLGRFVSVDGPAEGGTLTTVPAGWTGTNYPADIHVASNGRTLYVSNRGHNSIAVFSVAESTGALALEQVVSTDGDWPRNFSLHPSGRWLLVANQRSDSVVVFGRDPENGRLTPMRQRIALSSPVCLRFA